MTTEKPTDTDPWAGTERFSTTRWDELEASTAPGGMSARERSSVPLGKGTTRVAPFAASSPVLFSVAVSLRTSPSTAG